MCAKRLFSLLVVVVVGGQDLWIDAASAWEGLPAVCGERDVEHTGDALKEGAELGGTVALHH